MSSYNILELKSISKYYPGVTALNNVSLSIGEEARYMR